MEKKRLKCGVIDPDDMFVPYHHFMYKIRCVVCPASAVRL